MVGLVVVVVVPSPNLFPPKMWSENKSTKCENYDLMQALRKFARMCVAARAGTELGEVRLRHDVS